jgi:hypothetical protein
MDFPSYARQVNNGTVQLLLAQDPGLRHTQLRTVAQAHNMDFPSYARQVNNATAAGCPGSRAPAHSAQNSGPGP